MFTTFLAIAAQAAQPTVQQGFQQATALADSGKPAEALAAWEALEPRVAKNRRSLALIRIRKSDALFKLNRRDEAVAAARAGLAELPAGDATLREDRFLALLSLGLVAEDSLDYAGAVDLLTQAEAIADTPTQKVSVLRPLAQAATFVDPAKARAALDRADAVMQANTVDAKLAADFQDRRGLLLLNQGDFAGARKAFDQAIKLLGGMTLRVDSRDVQTRSDAAIAALLAGDQDAARKYMAYTGAGRLGAGKSFNPGVNTAPPDCGGESGLKPDDMAVVEFSIGDDGTILTSRPIYAAGGGRVALEFARATRGWSWAPEKAKELPAFFRYNVRMEMRCSTGFERPSLRDMMTGDLAEWLGGQGVALSPTPPSGAAAALGGQRAALAGAEAKNGPASLQALAALYTLMTSSVVGREETVQLATRASAIAAANRAPPLARMAIDMVLTNASTADGPGSRSLRAAYAALMARPDYAADPQARATIRMAASDAEKPQSERAVALLRQIADDPALAANDPLKVGALVRIASAEQASGDAAAARAAFDRSGLSASQCALLDTPPKMLGFGAEFPQEARMWGFEGWAQVQQDVTAAGKATNVRTIAAYPPFVFSKAARETFAGARYAKTFRPDGGPGCVGGTNRIRYTLQQ